MKNILLTIAYDGTNFSGWQRQPNQRTVQGELERVLSVLCGGSVRIEGTSRTDARVHAFGQRATLRGDFGIPTERIPLAANHLLSGPGPHEPGEIRILSAVEMPEGFHARYQCTGKTYRYRILHGGRPDPFCRNYFHWVERPLELERMQEAAGYIVGKHDFRCFQAAGGQERKTTVRRIFDLKVFGEEDTCRMPRPRFARESGAVRSSAGVWNPGESGTETQSAVIEVTGDGFLYNMVRIMVGTLIEVGLGRLEPERVREIIESGDRRNAGYTAPPQGLYLAEIYYNVLK